MSVSIKINQPNKALHWTAIPLRSIAAGKLGRYIPLNKIYRSP
jgi:hypothetical protein